MNVQELRELEYERVDCRQQRICSQFDIFSEY